MRLWLLPVVVFAMACSATHYKRHEPDAVVLYLKAPAARSVQIGASYNGYRLQHAQRVDSGLWSVRLPRHNEFRYFYLIDGNVFVPACEMKEQDDFGQTNCIYSPAS